MSIDQAAADGEDEQPFDNGEVAETAEAGDVERLDLGDRDEQLPWLESDEDFDEGGVDTGRVVIFALLGLLAIGLLVGGVWWLSRDRGDSELLADGSTIEAPDAPYKSRPDDPGGKTFAGTGDSSFAVAEGESREGRLANDTARPSINAATARDSAPDAADAGVSGKTSSSSAASDGDSGPAASSAANNGVGVQVGAYSSRQRAVDGWNTLRSQFEALQGVSYRVVEGQADIGTVFRLQAVAPNLASAKSLCGKLKAAGGACQVKP